MRPATSLKMRPTRRLLAGDVTQTASAIKPIQGMLKRSIVVDLSCALGLGVAAGYFWWYGYHVPAIRQRDRFYAKLEDQRIQAQSSEDED